MYFQKQPLIFLTASGGLKMDQTSTIFYQSSNIFDSPSFDTSIIKIKDTFKIGLQIRKMASNGLEMLSEPQAHPKLVIYSSLRFFWAISELNPLKFQIFVKLGCFPA